MATVVREIERKYDLATAGTASALDAVTSMTGVAGVASVSPQDEQILDAVYYDTADLRLIRAGVTLRRRTRWLGRRLAPEAARRCPCPGRDTPAPDRPRR